MNNDKIKEEIGLLKTLLIIFSAIFVSLSGHIGLSIKNIDLLLAIVIILDIAFLIATLYLVKEIKKLINKL